MSIKSKNEKLEQYAVRKRQNYNPSNGIKYTGHFMSFFEIQCFTCF